MNAIIYLYYCCCCCCCCCCCYYHHHHHHYYCCCCYYYCYNSVQKAKFPLLALIVLSPSAHVGDLLLLLHFQVDLWASSYWVRFLHVGPFINPTIEEVTFCLHGWRVLGVFLLPVFTRLGHECQDRLVHAMECVHRLDLGLCSRPKEFWGNAVRTHVTSKGEIPYTGGSEEVRIRAAASHRAAILTHYQLSYVGEKIQSFASVL